jgi:hypothetical protein
VPVLSDVFVIFFSSVLLLTSIGQLCCATIAFSEWYVSMMNSSIKQRGMHVYGV